MTDTNAEPDLHEQGVDNDNVPMAQPSHVQATRTRMQGGGMGARDLAGQGDPDRSVAAGDSAADTD